MCGISGIYHFKNADQIDEAVLSRMRDTLAHRGPDDTGVYISHNKKLGFGFRRLAIIDLSPAGHQPMSNEDGSVWAMLNGEIYNFEDLRPPLQKAGHIFRSKSDTEVIIHSYEEKGVRAVEDWNGMFAVALWDEKREELFLIRDRLGIKPIYYAIVNGALIFASEIKALLAYLGMAKKLNEEAVFHYLTFACAPAPMTLFEGIRKLPAGSYLKVSAMGIQEKRYWRAQAVQNGPRRENEYIEEIRAILTDSVKRQMISDRPFGVFLSGGIDSSTNVALMTSARGEPVDSFSVNVRDLPRYDEFRYARQVAQRFQSRHREITVGPQDLLDFLPRLAYHADDLNGDPVCFPLYYVSKLIRESGVIVAQVGEGADELFAGYDQYRLVVNFWKRFWRPAEKMPRALKKLLFGGGRLTHHPKLDLPREGLRRLAAAEEFFWGGAIAFPELAKQTILSKNFRSRMAGHSSFDVIKPAYAAIDAALPDADFLNRMMALELEIRLPELLLMRVDKISMAHSLEARVPYLDHRLVELAASIPMDLKIKNGISKYILKESVRGIIPDEIIDRKKQGFSAPIFEWLRNPAVASDLLKPLWHSKIWEADLFDRTAIQKLIEVHQTGKADQSFKIWNLLTLALWFDEWM